MATAKASKKKKRRILVPPGMGVLTVTEQMIEEAMRFPHGRRERIEVDLSGEGSSAAKPLTRTLKKFTYAGMDKNGTQRFKIRNKGVLPFELAGRLMRGVRRGTTGRIPEGEWQRIAAELDLLGLKPKDFLEGDKDRKVLGEYNRKNPQDPYKTFAKALKCRDVLGYGETLRDAAGNPTPVTRKLSCTLRRAVKNWLYSAGRSWNKTHPEP